MNKNSRRAAFFLSKSYIIFYIIPKQQILISLPPAIVAWAAKVDVWSCLQSLPAVASLQSWNMLKYPLVFLTSSRNEANTRLSSLSNYFFFARCSDEALCGLWVSVMVTGSRGRRYVKGGEELRPPWNSLQLWVISAVQVKMKQHRLLLQHVFTLHHN